MKYLRAFLGSGENPQHARSEEPTKPPKPVLEVLEGVPRRDVKEKAATKAAMPAWPCPHCGKPVEIEAVEPSVDGQRMLTFWHCRPCQSYAVTPDTLQEPPKGWGTKVRQ